MASEIREWCGLEDWEEEQISDMLAHFGLAIVDHVREDQDMNLEST